jgi:hypothetical protein
MLRERAFLVGLLLSGERLAQNVVVNPKSDTWRGRLCTAACCRKFRNPVHHHRIFGGWNLQDELYRGTATVTPTMTVTEPC